MPRRIDRRTLLTSHGWTAVGLSICLSIQPTTAVANGFRHLRIKDIELLRSMMPAVIGVDANSAQIDNATRRFDSLLGSLSPGNFNDIILLSDLLTNTVVRIMLGLWTPWQSATRAEIATFLYEKSQSSLSILRHGVQGICQLIHYAWYAAPEECHAIGYPGIPAVIKPYLKR